MFERSTYKSDSDYIHALEREDEVLTATLCAIRDAMEGMLAERYTPRTDILRKGLYPTEREITWYLDKIRMEKDLNKKE